MPVLCLLVSCAPKVTSTITRTYPSLLPDAQVEVLSIREVPAKSEQIGQVRVSDTGMSTKCDSLTVINKIKDEARKAGGNAVVITEHRKPSFWGSSCHQMTATVLNVSDFSGEVLAVNDVSGMEHLSMKLPKAERLLPRFNLSANFGYGWRTAKMADGLSREEKDYLDKLMSGIVWNAAASYYFKDNYGVGLSYSAYSASASGIGTSLATGESGMLKTDDMITYVGPAFLMRYSQNQKWIFNVSLGIGYIGYSSTSKLKGEKSKITGSSVGFESVLGAEYKFAQNWGIGASFSANSGMLNKLTVNSNGQKQTIDLHKDEKEGLGQIRLSLGLRYYIK